MRIVFVCTTNVWGSAVADLSARSLLSQWDPDRLLVQVESVGVRAQVGASVSSATQRVLADLGLQAGDHRARWMSPEVLTAADLTLTMGKVQRDAALALNPRGLRNTFTLLEAASLVDSLSVTAPLAPERCSHARAVVAGMAGARRFRVASADDLPDLLSGGAVQLRNLADRVQGAVRTILRALVLPDLSIHPAGQSTGPSAVAVA